MGHLAVRYVPHNFTGIGNSGDQVTVMRHLWVEIYLGIDIPAIRYTWDRIPLGKGSCRIGHLWDKEAVGLDTPGMRSPLD